MFPIQSGTDDAATLYVDDVFSTHLYTGNGSTQTITNGIDLAGKGGMVWIKRRDSASNNNIFDTVRGATNKLVSNTTTANVVDAPTLTTFNSSGFVLGADSNAAGVNQTGALEASWTFRKAPKFFDVVTYTGNSTNRTVPHSLGQIPGMVIVKNTTAAGGWYVWHNSFANNETIYLEQTAAKVSGVPIWNNTLPTASEFSLSSAAAVNASGDTYVAYLFAHDTSADGIIQCGSFTTDASGNATVNLGWEPQYFLVKAAGIAQNWFVVDAVRGMSHTSNSTLYPNLSNTEALAANNGYVPTATGLQINGALSAVQSYIYLAIRRSNKPPTSGTQVFQPMTYTGNIASNRLINTGILTDLVFARARTYSGIGSEGMVVGSRLTGDGWMKTALTQAELTTNGLQTPTAGYGDSFSAMNGFGITGPEFGSASYGNLNGSGVSCIAHAFKRAKGFMDVVCYTGTGVNRTVSHNLGVAPELMIIKSRSSGSLSWAVYAGTFDNLSLNLNSGWTYGGLWNDTYPNSSLFSLGTHVSVNSNGASYIAILFATLPGISKVGTFTISGSDVNVDCGFTTGARYVLLKYVNPGADWYVFDTARGITAGNDPYLLLNTSSAEGTGADVLIPYSAGFTARHLALGNATFLYLAIA